jgi:N-methylhydantoinase A
VIRVGIDTGGTHTDLIAWDISKNAILCACKVPTTPDDLLKGIINGLEHINKNYGIRMTDVVEIVYGTTYGTNMVAQKVKIKAALLTTEGFRDVLEIGRAYRKDNIYDVRYKAPESIVPRKLRIGIQERMNFLGQVILPLDEESVRKAAKYFKDVGVETIAISFLHSYMNPIHERMARSIINDEYPEVSISLSSDICPVFREYERTSTTVLNAFLKPGVAHHLKGLRDSLSNLGFTGSLYVMQSNGGITGFDFALSKPIALLNSGPAAGVIAGAAFSREEGFDNVITFDMGGTSADVSLVSKEPQHTSESEVLGFPINIPTVDVLSIGAGGGSLAWVDKGGVLKVGPNSAGSFPGPACYGRGGKLPTVTDANLVLGRINPEGFLNNQLNLRIELAEKAIIKEICNPLNNDLYQAAEGIIRVTNSNMIRALKLISVSRGNDPREFALVALGGAAGLHIAEIALELGIKTAIIPSSPGTGSALGLLLADMQHNYVRTFVKLLNQVKPEDLSSLFQALKDQAETDARKENVPISDLRFSYSCELRYFGQGYEINVGVDEGYIDLELLNKNFHKAHEKKFGHCFPKSSVELVNVCVSMYVNSLKPSSLASSQDSDNLNSRDWEIVYKGKKIDCHLIQKKNLQMGQCLQGPCIIEEHGSTVFLPSETHLEVGRNFSLIIQSS